MPARKPSTSKIPKTPSKTPSKITKRPTRSRTAIKPENFVYVLGTVGKDGRRLTYVGWTNDVARRLARHNDGTGARTTRGRSWVLLYSEACTSRRHAMSREWHLKRDRTFRKTLAGSLKT